MISMMKKLLALLLVVMTVAGFMVPVHAAENSGRMSLEMIGPAHMDLDDEIIDYGVYVSNTDRLATITVTVELDPNYVSYHEANYSPWVEQASGWTIISYRFKEENGSLICSELLGLPGSTPVVSTPEARTAEYYKKRPCAMMVETAARIFADYLEKAAKPSQE